MKINLGDKSIRNALNLTSEELINLLRYQNPKTSSADAEIVSPVLFVFENVNIQSTIVGIQDNNYRETEQPYYDSDDDEEFRDLDGGMVEEDGSIGGRRKKSKNSKDSVKNIPSFVLEVELTRELFDELLKVKEVLILMRVQNIPVYVLTNKAQIQFNLEESKKPKFVPSLAVKIDKVRAIVELLKTQISESDFFEVYVKGKSDEFFEKGGADLDDLVGIIGIRRKPQESDIELRMRVKSYLITRMEELSKVKDEDLQNLIKDQAEKDRIEKKMDDAKEKDDKK